MKKQKKLVIWTIMSLLIILIPFKINALTDQSGDYLNTNVTYHDGPGHVYKQWTYNDNSFSGYKDGKVYFNLTITGKFEIYNVTILSENKNWVCYTGATTSYKDNDNQFIFVSAECPIDFNRGNKLQAVVVEGYAQGNSYYYINYPVNFSYYSYDTPKSTIQAIQDSSSTTAVNNLATQTHQDSEALKNAINQAKQQEQTNYSEFKNTDISNQAKQQPDTQEYEDVETSEGQVYDNLDDININSLIDMQIDLDTSNWIWNTMTSIFNANARIFTMVISILSLGLCKFVLGR